jgi:lysophospholipase L1-like esterase
MSCSITATGATLLLGMSQAQAPSSQSFALKHGDRVLFYGDSITAQRMYTRLVEVMVVSRYPKMRVNFYSAGVSGDTVYGGQAGDAAERVPRDVAPFHPTVVTVSLGANDGHYTLDNADATFASYQKGYRALIELLKQSADASARFTLTSPVGYDEITRPAPVLGYNGVLIRYGGFVKQLAEENHFAFADFNRAMTTLLAAEKSENLTAAQELLPDHLHPSIWGHWALAAEMVRTWGFDPLVSAVSFDAATGKIRSAVKADVRELQTTATGLTWSQLDADMPLPLDLSDPLTQISLKTSDLAQLDQQTLQVSGLTEKTYTLAIDGKKITMFTAEQLASGVNLALYETPMESQARSIDWDGAERRAKLSAIRLGLMTQKPLIAGREDAVKKLDVLDSEMLDGEYRHAQPAIHRFELKAENNAR